MLTNLCVCRTSLRARCRDHSIMIENRQRLHLTPARFCSVHVEEKHTTYDRMRDLRKLRTFTMGDEGPSYTRQTTYSCIGWNGEQTNELKQFEYKLVYHIACQLSDNHFVSYMYGSGDYHRELSIYLCSCSSN